MRARINRWWLLPAGILVASALLSLNVVVFGAPLVARSAAEPVPLAAGSQAEAQGGEQGGAGGGGGGCSGALTTDYACHQERYRKLVQDSGVEEAFAGLKADYEENDFVKSNCHQMTHVIGRAAGERYGDIPATYSRGDNFCGSGYYHGAIEAVVARVGPEKIVEEADTICAELREGENRSGHHYGCAHGLGHGFMAVLENDLFESLKACGALTDEWEDVRCSGGVFMENLMQDRPGRPSKYLKADQPLYPCGEVEDKYKPTCYGRQTSYVLETQGNDFARVFEICATAEADHRSVCYYGLGNKAAYHSIEDTPTEVARNESARRVCMLGPDHEARYYCVRGVAAVFVYHYASDAQAKTLCESLENADLRATCLQKGEEVYKEFHDKTFES
jgi:hypothetical protein